MSENDDHNGGIAAALRSVWFYYIACTPCRKVGHRRETRKEAERERDLKARLELEQPGLYQHPNPENTNHYWMEDINMGPALPKRGANRNPSQSKVKNSGPDARAETPAGSTSPRGRGTSSSSSGHFPSAETAGSPTVVADDEDIRTTMSMSVTDSQDLDWNRKRYDREDEELWGHNGINKAGQRLREVITKGRDTAGRLFETGRPQREREITEEERVQFYTAPRNPPVNDYHPPVVSSRPASKHEFQWMLQPPPPAKVMEGKVPVSRSGSLTSVGSRRTNTAASLASKEELGLGRLVSEKIVKDKIRKGEKPNNETGELTLSTRRPSTRRARTASTMSSLASQQSTRSRSNTTGSESSDTIYERRRKRRMARQRKAEAAAGSEADDETDDEQTTTQDRQPSQQSHRGSHDRHASQRPKLQTIASSELSSQKSATGSDKMTMHAPILATMAGPALDDVTNRSAADTNAAAFSATEGSDKERAAGASVDSGLALA